jgi:hypothetical protein
VIACRAELTFCGTEVEAHLLREMAHTFSAAATQLRLLRAAEPD